MPSLVESIKIAALDALEAAKPTSILFGYVESNNPLQIRVEQKFVLDMEQLILTKNVTDHEVDVTVDWMTETTSQHNHRVEGRKRITLHNGLDVGEKVLLLRQQGGQKFVIWDRVMT